MQNKVCKEKKQKERKPSVQVCVFLPVKLVSDFDDYSRTNKEQKKVIMENALTEYLKKNKKVSA
jgi:hypothetical protein